MTVAGAEPINTELPDVTAPPTSVLEDVALPDSDAGNSSSGVLNALNDEPGGLEPPTEKPPTHEDVSRRLLAVWLMVLLTFLIGATFVAFAGLFFTKNTPTFDQLKTLCESVLTPLITLVSAATGFYFGSATKK